MNNMSFFCHAPGVIVLICLFSVLFVCHSFDLTDLSILYGLFLAVSVPQLNSLKPQGFRNFILSGLFPELAIRLGVS